MFTISILCVIQGIQMCVSRQTWLLFSTRDSVFLEHHVVSGCRGKASQCGSHLVNFFNAENTSIFCCSTFTYIAKTYFIRHYIFLIFKFFFLNFLSPRFKSGKLGGWVGYIPVTQRECPVKKVGTYLFRFATSFPMNPIYLLKRSLSFNSFG